MHSKGFTLLELLIVIAILAVLATVAVLVINPLEYVKQSRDAKRIADFVALNKAIQIYDFNTTASSTATLASTTVYLSLPDNASTTCGSYTLPILPTGYRYNCVTSANLQKVDGTGWIPLNLSVIPGGSPLSVLPIDPNNNVLQRTYYTFVGGGGFQLASAMESTRYKAGGDKDAVTKDGGTLSGLYEAGTSYSLMPIDYGDSSLVGYWNFESTGTVKDVSGNGRNCGSVARGIGKVGSAGVFSGGISCATPSVVNGPITFTAWINTATTTGGIIGFTSYSPTWGYSFTYGGPNASYQPGLAFQDSSATWRSKSGPAFNPVTFLSTWHHIAVTYDGAIETFYLDGQLYATQANTYFPGTSTNTLSMGAVGWSALVGSLDEVRMYNRALPAAEVQALYNATK